MRLTERLTEAWGFVIYSLGVIVRIWSFIVNEICGYGRGMVEECFGLIWFIKGIL